MGEGVVGVETGEEHMKECSGWNSMSLPKVRAIPACALFQKVCSAWHAAGLWLNLVYFLVNDIQREHVLQERVHKSKYYG